MLRSRNISVDEFLRDFFDTLTPGVIPRNQFIDWTKIRTKCEAYRSSVEYFSGLSRKNARQLIEDIRDSLLSSDEPADLLKGAFELLGHTGDLYVSDADCLSIEEAAERIKENNDQRVASRCAQVVVELGLKNITDLSDLSSAFVGVQVGLESNRRKSIGGGVFNSWVLRILESTCGLLGPECSVTPEAAIKYKNGVDSKRVDFAIMHRNKVRVGVEVNFFTTSGSKPSEIKRAYENVGRQLKEVGVELVWVTDGAGYLRMKKGIGEAFRIHPNTYNYDMAKRFLKNDLAALFNIGTQEQR